VREAVHAAFAKGWSIESIERTRAEVRPDFKEFKFSEGGPKAGFVVVRRARTGKENAVHPATGSMGHLM